MIDTYNLVHNLWYITGNIECSGSFDLGFLRITTEWLFWKTSSVSGYSYVR